MSITPLSGAASSIAGTPATSKLGHGAERFAKMLKAQVAPKPQENAPISVAPSSNVTEARATQSTARASRVDAHRSTSATRLARPVDGAKPADATRVLDSVTAAQKKMDQILKVAESGKNFSAAELLSLQAHVYRASQELDLAGKVVEKATGGLKQVLQTQV